MFNSIKCVKILEEAGVSRNQAEAQVHVISEILEMNLVTKKDISILQSEIAASTKQDFASVKMELAVLEQKIVQSEQRVTIKLGAIVSVAIGIAVALAKIVS